jgi:tetratricopeptide (TPR) repeat protein
MKQAVNFDGENFLVFFTYGKMLRKTRRHDEAVKALLKAKELNPQYLPIYNELGRAYSINGEFDKAEVEFRKALTEQKYPNIRHKVMTLQFLGDNFRRKGEACRDRKDTGGETQNLNSALDNVEEAMSLSPSDKILPNLRASILIDLGIAYSKSVGIEKGSKYFNAAMEPLYFGNFTLQPSGETICEATYYLAVFLESSALISKDEIERLIRKGYSSCPADSKFITKFKNLEDELLKSNRTAPSGDEKLGIIKYFVSHRKYGVIEANGEGFLFFPNSFSEYTSPNDILGLVGMSVSFIAVEQKGKQVARKIRLIK